MKKTSNEYLIRYEPVDAKHDQLINFIAKMNKEVNDFTYIVSHDLKASLCSISLLAGVIVSDYRDRFSNEGNGNIDILIKRVKRIDYLINGFLPYSRIGHIKEDEIKLNLNSLILDVVFILSPPENIKIEVNLHFLLINLRMCLKFMVIKQKALKNNKKD